MAGTCRIDTRILKGYIAQYKSELHNLRLGEHYEIYKWKAVKCFQDHWDIQATDFPVMVKSAFSQTKNLLASKNYYPRQAIEDMAGVAPEQMRAAFIDLFDESKDVVKRVVEFEKACTRILPLKPEMRQHYQTPNAISTYLWLRYPDKYYVYKYSEKDYIKHGTNS